MHPLRFRSVLVLVVLPALTSLPAAFAADTPASPPPASPGWATTPSDGVAASSDDTAAKLAGALRSFSLVEKENDDLKAQIDKLTADNAALGAQLATLKNALPVAAQAQGLREQLRQTQAEMATLAGENADLRTKLALLGPAPGSLPPPSVVRPEPTTPAMAPVPASPPPAAAPRTYTVAAGDTLSRIAVKFYGTSSRWPDILAANRDTLKDEKSLSAGQTIRIP